MIDVLLKRPTLHFYGKANSGKTATLLKINEIFAPYYKEVHFFSPNRASYYESIITQTNVIIHSVNNSQKLIAKLANLDKCNLVIIDDITIISNLEEWKSTDKTISEFGFRKLLISMDANPNMLSNAQSFPAIRCGCVNERIMLYCQEEVMSLSDALLFLNRNLTLDDYCGSM